MVACHEGTQPHEVAVKLQAAATAGTIISLQGFELMPDVVCTVIAAQLRSLLKVACPLSPDGCFGAVLISHRRCQGLMRGQGQRVASLHTQVRSPSSLPAAP